MIIALINITALINVRLWPISAQAELADGVCSEEQRGPRRGAGRTSLAGRFHFGF